MSRLHKKPPRQAGLRDKTKLLVEAAGGHRKLGRLLGVSYQAIGQWDRVPAEWLIEIEILTGVLREQLRPDLYRGFVRRKAKV